jgi:hypothetical protein
MRILIQDPETKSYFCEDKWDDDELNATEFGNVSQAEEFCRQHDLPLALIVVKFKDAANDIRYAANSPDTGRLRRLSTRRVQ